MICRSEEEKSLALPVIAGMLCQAEMQCREFLPSSVAQCKEHHFALKISYL